MAAMAVFAFCCGVPCKVVERQDNNLCGNLSHQMLWWLQGMAIQAWCSLHTHLRVNGMQRKHQPSQQRPQPVAGAAGHPPEVGLLHGATIMLLVTILHGGCNAIFQNSKHVLVHS